jgi:hypothetical protein
MGPQNGFVSLKSMSLIHMPNPTAPETPTKALEAHYGRKKEEVP